MMPQRQKKILSIPIAIAFCALTIGTLFKIQHWPFGIELRLTSLIAIGVFYTIRYGAKKSKNIKDLAKVIMVLSWVLLSVLAMYKMNNLVYLRIILEISGVSWLAIETWDVIKKKPKSERANLPQLIGMLILITHVIFRIQHWPYAGAMLVLSLFAFILIAIGFILDSAQPEEDYL
ncbi:MAG: hypothetical protein ACFHU9_00570 [Fluviicola sp.]